MKDGSELNAFEKRISNIYSWFERNYMDDYPEDKIILMKKIINWFYVTSTKIIKFIVGMSVLLYIFGDWEFQKVFIIMMFILIYSVNKKEGEDDKKIFV